MKAATTESRQGPGVGIVCKTDGLCEIAVEGGSYNPGGVATYGFFICDGEGRPIAKDSGVVGQGEGIDHLVAEYEAVLQALRYLLRSDRTGQPVVVQNDNQQLILEMTGRREVRTARHESRYHEVWKLTSRFEKIRYEQISGDSNWEADCLSWKAYRQFLSDSRSII